MEKDEKLKSKVLVLDSGERVVIVINSRTAIPHLELNRYLFHCRKPVVSFKSLKKEAETLCVIFSHLPRLLWEEDYLKVFKVLTSKEIYKMWELLRISSKGRVVESATHMYKWDVFYRVADYLTDSAILKESHLHPDFKNLETKKRIILKEIKRLRYTSKSNRLEGLNKKVVISLLEVTRANSEDNPWIPRDQLRNQVIVDILIKLGVRSGELLKISLNDLILGTGYPHIVIKRSINDKEDSRKNEPRVKTFGRILEIDHKLAQDIGKLLKSRRTVPNAKKNKFLFVSNSTGSPLSYDRIHAILSDIKFNKYPEIKITPHALRRTWNDLFREYAEESGVDQEIITQTQNYLQGRVLNSPEANKYSAKYIERSARKTHLEFQNSILIGSEK